MSAELLFYLPGNESLALSLSQRLQCPIGKAEIRHFPDGESYIRLNEDVRGKKVIIVCTLIQPDDKLLPLYFLSSLLREFGAKQITLVAPYLAYMRQDTRFKEGEAITSSQFAQLISRFVDQLVTIDPHLHRRSKLGEIYTIPTKVLHAAPLISKWVKANMTNAVLIGPDEESEQWVLAIAEDAGVPYVVMRKERRSDTEVKITTPQLDLYKQYQPVLVDDIISTANTMAETVKKLKQQGFATVTCIGVHGIFAGQALSLLESSGARVITTNSIPSTTSQIDISELIAEAIKE